MSNQPPVPVLGDVVALTLPPSASPKVRAAFGAMALLRLTEASRLAEMALNDIVVRVAKGESVEAAEIMAAAEAVEARQLALAQERFNRIGVTIPTADLFDVYALANALTVEAKLYAEGLPDPDAPAPRPEWADERSAYRAAVR